MATYKPMQRNPILESELCDLQSKEIDSMTDEEANQTLLNAGYDPAVIVESLMSYLKERNHATMLEFLNESTRFIAREKDE